MKATAKVPRPRVHPRKRAFKPQLVVDPRLQSGANDVDHQVAVKKFTIPEKSTQTKHIIWSAQRTASTLRQVANFLPAFASTLIMTSLQTHGMFGESQRGKHRHCRCGRSLGKCDGTTVNGLSSISLLCCGGMGRRSRYRWFRFSASDGPEYQCCE